MARGGLCGRLVLVSEVGTVTAGAAGTPEYLHRVHTWTSPAPSASLERQRLWRVRICSVSGPRSISPGRPGVCQALGATACPGRQPHHRWGLDLIPGPAASRVPGRSSAAP